MELSWSSFLLEIINFIVLMWILKHFFYSPIKKVISERKIAIEDNINKAEKLNNEAHQLQMKYENRLKDWESEKSLKNKSIQQELEEWKSHEMTNFEKKIKDEREKIYSREMQRVSSVIEDNARESFKLSAVFATRFLTNFADNHLEEKIIDKIIYDLSHLSDEKRQLLKNNIKNELEISVQSAYLINESQRQRLIDTFKNILGSNINTTFTQNKDLLAGLNIRIGSVLLQASLLDELNFFAEVEINHA